MKRVWEKKKANQSRSEKPREGAAEEGLRVKLEKGREQSAKIE